MKLYYKWVLLFTFQLTFTHPCFANDPSYPKHSIEKLICDQLLLGEVPTGHSKPGQSYVYNRPYDEVRKLSYQFFTEIVPIFYTVRFDEWILASMKKHGGFPDKNKFFKNSENILHLSSFQSHYSFQILNTVTFAILGIANEIRGSTKGFDLYEISPSQAKRVDEFFGIFTSYRHYYTNSIYPSVSDFFLKDENLKVLYLLQKYLQAPFYQKKKLKLDYLNAKTEQREKSYERADSQLLSLKGRLQLLTQVKSKELSDTVFSELETALKEQPDVEALKDPNGIIYYGDKIKSAILELKVLSLFEHDLYLLSSWKSDLKKAFEGSSLGLKRVELFASIAQAKTRVTLYEQFLNKIQYLLFLGEMNLPLYQVSLQEKINQYSKTGSSAQHNFEGALHLEREKASLRLVQTKQDLSSLKLLLTSREAELLKTKNALMNLENEIQQDSFQGSATLLAPLQLE